MNTALALLRHALGLLTEAPLKTLAVVAPALVLMCGVGAITALTAPELLALDPTNPDLQSIKSVRLSAILLGTFILSYALMAILWHRHTLGSIRKPQPMTAPLIGGYLWRVVALALIQLVAGLALVIPLLIASQSGTAGARPPALPSMMLTTFITQLLLLWLSLRLSLILPAAALGRPISMRVSWQHTLPLTRPLWGVAAVLALVNTALTGLTTLFDLSRPVHALVLELPIYIIEGLLIFSVLTTLYARQIQKTDNDSI
ncbi:hypothetical protein [uncultured Sulfitobacter sp.]|uniref:hypothetical protein n=1 Tax=uncultured Sulfitobacter sp. TaxID=191468 RepID=UPI00260A8C14|nr:hypothetical protein [uncultured Sulfitobacter sp.]